MKTIALRVAAVGLMGALCGAGSCVAQTPSAKDLVNTMVARELDAASHKQLLTYLSVERSDRTGGKLWAEHVVETPIGRVRFLMTEDGQPLSTDRAAQERARLAADVADPQGFAAREKAQKDDEAHARSMLELLAKGFLLENVRADGPDWRLDFRPDPDYSPSGMEEKVLHAMSGYLLVDQKTLRMHHIEGRMPQDLSLAFGLASVHAGSNFSSTKVPFEGNWRTRQVISDIRGKAVLFKTIAKNQAVDRSDFHHVDAGMTLAQAVALAERL